MKGGGEEREAGEEGQMNVRLKCREMSFDLLYYNSRKTIMAGKLKVKLIVPGWGVIGWPGHTWPTTPAWSSHLPAPAQSTMILVSGPKQDQRQSNLVCAKNSVKSRGNHHI